MIRYRDAGLSRQVHADYIAGAYTNRDELRDGVRRAWLVDGGQGIITESAWLDLFVAANFPKPDAALRLYRGASHARRTGWSWTPSREMAAAYARSRCPLKSMGCAFPIPPRPVWTVVAPPEAVLGCWTTTSFPPAPDVLEYVVLADGLDVQLDP